MNSTDRRLVQNMAARLATGCAPTGHEVQDFVGDVFGLSGDERLGVLSLIAQAAYEMGRRDEQMSLSTSSLRGGFLVSWYGPYTTREVDLRAGRFLPMEAYPILIDAVPGNVARHAVPTTGEEIDFDMRRRRLWLRLVRRWATKHRRQP